MHFETSSSSPQPLQYKIMPCHNPGHVRDHKLSSLTHKQLYSPVQTMQSVHRRCAARRDLQGLSPSVLRGAPAASLVSFFAQLACNILQPADCGRTIHLRHITAGELEHTKGEAGGDARHPLEQATAASKSTGLRYSKVLPAN